MNNNYRSEYFIAFDLEDNVIAHNSDESECAKQAGEGVICKATRLTTEQFCNELENAGFTENQILKISWNFCGKLIYKCRNYLCDNQGVVYRKIGSINISLSE